MTDDRYSTTRRLLRSDSFSAPFNVTSLSWGGLRRHGLIKKDDPTTPLVSIVTVVKNGVGFLEETIQSVISQSYENVEYIVIDGGSDDGTVEIIRTHENAIDLWVSEPDAGFYDGLAKGMSLTTGSIIGYLNADDVYFPGALSTVADVFVNCSVEWITGNRSMVNEKSQVVSVDLPLPYDSGLIAVGAYGRQLPFIQQESTFWSSILHAEIDFSVLSRLRLAGDYYLWTVFARRHRLEVVSSSLGAFRIRRGQISENLSAYRHEMNNFCRSIGLADTFKLLLHFLRIWTTSAYARRNIWPLVYFDSNVERWILRRRRSFSALLSALSNFKHGRRRSTRPSGLNMDRERSR